jgi:hypothetical protein
MLSGSLLHLPAFLERFRTFSPECLRPFGKIKSSTCGTLNDIIPQNFFWATARESIDPVLLGRRPGQ